MVTGTWGLWGHVLVLQSIPFPSLAAQGSQSLDAAGVYELVVFLWDGSVQRRVLAAQQGPGAAPGRDPRVPTGNPGLSQPRPSRVAMERHSEGREASPSFPG